MSSVGSFRCFPKRGNLRTIAGKLPLPLLAAVSALVWPAPRLAALNPAPVARSEALTLSQCLSGPGRSSTDAFCARFDVDVDSDVDLQDLAALERGNVQQGSATADPGGPYEGSAADRVEGGWTFTFDGSGSTSDAGITSWAWNFGAETFDGPWLNQYQWITRAVYNDDALYGIASDWWGSCYAFTREPIQRAAGVSFRATVVVNGVHQIWGFNDASGGYGFDNMTYAIYFVSGEVRVYENGAHRVTAGSINYEEPVEVRIDLKPAAGARYFIRRAGATEWTLIYDSGHSAIAQVLAGFLPHGGKFRMDDVVLILGGETVTHKVYRGGPVGLTVAAADAATDFAETQVAIADDDLVAVAGGPYECSVANRVEEGWTFTFDASASSVAHEIPDSLWDFGPESFDGQHLNTSQWITNRAYQDNELRVGPGVGWGTAYAFTRETLPRVGGNAFEARVTFTSGHMIWGLKDTSDGHGPDNVVYGYYVTPSMELRVYEAGAHRTTPASLTPGTPIDLRIELKPVQGARFYIRRLGEPAWTLVYDSAAHSTTDFRRGVLVHGGTLAMDDMREVFKSAGPQLVHKVYRGGPALLTLWDSARQSATVGFDVVVTPAGPTADVGGPYALPEDAYADSGWTFTLDGTGSTGGPALVRYEWDLGVDTFDGMQVDSQRYLIRNVYQHDALHLANTGGWGGAYAFARMPIRRTAEAVAQARVIPPYPSHNLWGFKDTSSSYSGDNMPYCFYFLNGEVRVYEFGAYKSTVASYTAGVAYDLRIVLKNTQGARYYFKPASESEWRLAYDSAESAIAEVISGAVGHTGAFVLDDFVLRYYGDTLSWKVQSPTAVSLSVTDLLGQTSTDATTIDIVGNPPTADAGTYYLTEADFLVNGSKLLTFDGSGSADDYGIVRYEWDFGVDTLDGIRAEPAFWSTNSATRDDRFVVTGWGSWASGWAFHKQVMKRSEGATFEVRFTPRVSGHAMIGLKDLSAGFSYPQLPYALYFHANGNIYAYEDGADRGHVGSFAWGASYFIRIVLKAGAGAEYWIRPAGTADWTRLYDSGYGTASEFLRGATLHSGTFELDDLVQRFVSTEPTYDVLIDKAVEPILTVYDRVGRSDSHTASVQIGGASPTAHAGGPYEAPVGSYAVLDATLSADDTGIVHYQWDFGDGAVGDGILAHHAYTAAGVYNVTLTVLDAAGRQDVATTVVEVKPAVVTVPWDYDLVSGLEVPHNVWDGLSARLKAVLFTDTPLTVPGVNPGDPPVNQIAYTWDFGDGSDPETGTVTDGRTIETHHAYRGTAGTLFTATLTIHDPVHGDLVDTYPVQIHERDLTIEVNVAIEEGLWWLHRVQETNGGWGSYGGYRAGSTASAIHAMEINGHVPSRSTLADPLVEDVVRGLRHLFTTLSITNITVQAHGDPDSNANGIGIGVNSDRPIYEGGMVMDAIAASGVPDMTAPTGTAGIIGRTFRDILQDMVDQYTWGQVDTGYYEGGWRYSWNDQADNSACQWAAIGIHGARTFGLDVPDWVKQENDIWLRTSYNGTGFGYTGPGNAEATTPSGMVQLSIAGAERDDPRWQTAEAWLANNFDWFKNTGNVYAWYAFVKAMRLALPTPVANLAPTGLDWYHDERGLIRRILSRQNADGGWPDYYGRQFATAWQVVILTPTLFTRPPVAQAGSDVVWAFDRPLPFDASQSYRTDPVRVLAQYEWDFDGDGVYDYVGLDPRVEYTFAFDDAIEYPAVYHSRLRVTDDVGQTDTDTRTVTIAEPPHAPFAVIGGPYTVGQNVTFRPDGSGSYDIDPSDYITRMEWDFDGGNGYDFDQPDAAVDCPPPPDACPPVTWVFATQGIYNVGLRVWDNGVLHPDGAKLSSQPDFTVVAVGRNDPPVADPGGPYEVEECRELQLDGSASSDPNGDGITYAWDLDGDGEFDDSTEPAPRRTWNDGGVYTIALVVSDGPLESEPASAEVTVYDTAPSVTLTGPDVLLTDQAGAFQAAVESLCDELVSIEWDWDYDGIGFRPSGDTGLVQDHRYALHGTYVVAVRATDDDGSATLAAHQVAVAPVSGPRVPAEHLIRILIGPRDYNAVTHVHRGQFSLISLDDAPIQGPVVLAFKRFVPDTVSLLTVDGYVPDPADPQTPIPYIDFGDLLTGGVLAPGQTIGPKWIAFANPSDAAFTFDAIPFVFNSAPRITSTPVTSAREGVRYRYDVEATDPDGDVPRFHLIATNGTPPPSGMTVNPVSGLIDWVPGQQDAGDHPVTVVADDGLSGGQALQTFVVTVDSVNVAPVITSAPWTAVTLGEHYTYQIDAYDPDGDPLRFALSDGPDTMTVDPDTGWLEWTVVGTDNPFVRVTVSDSQGNETAQSFLLTILACLEPPVILSSPVNTAAEGATYHYQVDAVTFGGPLSYSLPVAPAGMAIDAAGSIDWTPSYTAHGMHTVKVRVAEGAANCYTEQIFQVEVADANAAPAFVTAPVIVAIEGASYRYAAQAVDPDGDTVAYRLVTAPPGMTVDAVAGVVEWTPSQAAGDSGPYAVELEASDPLGASTTQPYEIEVGATELPPRIVSTPVYGAVEDALYEYDVEAVDPDGDVLAFALGQGPAGMTIDPDTGLVQWLSDQTAAQFNPHNVEVTVHDPLGHSASQLYAIYVRATNVPPVITSESVLDAVEGEVYHYFVRATDEDGDTLSFRLVAPPGGMNIHPSTGHLSWLVPQTAAVDGPYDVTVAVSDGTDTTRQSFQITAAAVNSRPIIYSAPITAAAVGSHYEYDVQANDLDRDPVAFRLDVAPAGMAIDENAGLIAWDPQAGQDGEHLVTVAASDPEGLTATQTFTITVAPCPDAPEFTSTPVTTARPDVEYRHDVEARVNNGTITYELSVFPDGMTIAAASGLIAWTPTADQAGLHDVTVLAIRDAVCPSAQSFQVDVRACDLTVTYPMPLMVPGRLTNFEPQIAASCVPLTFALVSGPTGMTIDPNSGLIQWVSQLGLFSAEVEVTDAWGTLLPVTLAGEVLPESPPTITSIPVFTARVAEPYAYQVEADDPDRDTLEYSLVTAPVGMTVDPVAGLVSWTPTAGDIGSHPVEIMVDDLRGWQVVQGYTLTVSLTGDNEPPEITSTPAFAAAAGFTYTYQVVAEDPNGDALTYSLDEKPAGMTIDPVSGLVTWMTSDLDTGDHTVTVRATDPFFAWTSQSYMLRVYVNTAPTILSNPVTNAIVSFPYSYHVTAFDPDEAGLSFTLSVAPERMTIDSGTGEIDWTPTADQVGDHAVSIVVRDSTLAEARQDFNLTVHADADADLAPPRVVLSVEPEFVNAGEPVTISVIATDDFAVAWIVVTVNGARLPLDGTRTSFTPRAGGSYVVQAVATDVVGRTGRASADFFARTPGDGTPPLVDITSPAIDSVVKAPTQIVGSASDEHLHKYTLAYRRVGDDSFTEFANGYASVVDGVLGVFDPTMLMNGPYDIRLQALDTNGNVQTLVTSCSVEGDLKIGAFTISFIDLTVPLSGIPITIKRTYDSRNKSDGDFGYGWTLDVSSITAKENRPLGKDWQQTVGGRFVHIYQLTPLRDPVVSVTWPDGRIDRFAMQINPSQQAFFPIDFFNSVSFSPIPPTTSTLQVVGDTSGFYDGGAPLYGGPPSTGNLNFYSGDLFDPSHYRLTTYDGMVYTFSGDWGGQISGLQSVTDPNENSLQIVRDGIVHSSGVRVTFTRDAAGRITTITDPAGAELHFGYDTEGNLIAVTDRQSNTVEFLYDDAHYLTEIIDPSGNTPARYVYDDHGRLVSSIDAEGNRVNFQRDLDARQEIVSDAKGNVTIHEYDANGNVTAVIDPLGNRAEYTFDERGNELTESDALGNITTCTYDAHNNVLTKADPLGNTTTYVRDAKGRLLSVTDPAGNRTTNEYDGRGNLIRSVDPAGHVSTYTYDAAGNRTSAVNPLGRVTTYAYDSFGNMIRQTDSDGAVVEMTYDTNGNRLSKTRTRTTLGSPRTVTETYAYDSQGRRIETVDAAGATESTEYNALGWRTALVDKLGNRTERQFNVRGQLVAIVHPDGTQESWTYDENGKRLTATDRGGRTTAFTYDAVGRLTRTTFPDGAFTQAEYDAAGRAIRRIDGRGNATAYEYDAAGRVAAVTDALGNVTRYTRDVCGRVLTNTDARGLVTRFEYDVLGRCVRTVFPDGTWTTTEYDQAGHRVAQTDPAGHVVRFAEDDAGNVTGVTDPNGAVTSLAYDELGNLTVQTDANGHAARFEYDDLGRRTRRTLPLGMDEEVTYDAAGNRTGHASFRGDVLTLEYNTDSRTTRKLLPGGETVTFSYLPGGMLHSETDSRGVTVYEYDSRDRLLRRTDPDGGVVAYTYDPAGNRTSITTSGGTTTYAYDALNRLTTVIDPESGRTLYTYDAVGNRTSLTYPNGVRTVYTYDSRNRLTYVETAKAATGDVLASYAYTLGPSGNRIRSVEQGGRTVDYVYDDLYRLTRETITHPVDGVTTVDYAYDAVGNRLSKSVIAPAGRTHTLYTYDDNDRLVSEIRTTTLVGVAIDAASRLASTETRRKAAATARLMQASLAVATMTALLIPCGLLRIRRGDEGVAARRRRTLIQKVALVLLPVMVLGPQTSWAFQIQAAMGQALAGAVVAAPSEEVQSFDYTYDDNGNLIRRTDGALTDAYVYDAENRLIEADVQMGDRPGHVVYAYDASGIRIGKTENGASTQYRIDHNTAYARVMDETDGTVSGHYVYGDDLISVRRDGVGKRYYLYDGHMSVRGLADETGAVTDTYDYDAFGVLLASTGSTPNEFRYAGEQYDATVGFYYLRARYYDPSSGRFATMDTWEGVPFDPPTLHKYAYCHNDPGNNRDPSGNTLLERVIVIAIIAILVAIGLQVWENETCKYFKRVTENSSITMDNLPDTLSTAYGGVLGSKPELAIAFRDQYRTEYTSLRDDACGDAAAKVLSWVDKFDGWVGRSYLTPEERKHYRWSPHDAPDSFYVLPFRAQYAYCYLATGYQHQMASLTPKDDQVVSDPEWVMLDAWNLAPVPVYDLMTLRSASMNTSVRIGEQGGF